MHFHMISPMMVSNLSAPSSPSYSVIKSEEGLRHQNFEYLVYPSFDVQSPPTPQPPHHILPSQRSPHPLPSSQQRMMSYNDVSLMQQRQHSHQQQMRIQQQQQQYHSYHSQQQLMYDPQPTASGRPAISSAMSMSMPLSVSIPVTSGSSALMVNSSTSTNSASLFTPTSAATPIPFFGPSFSPSALSKDEAAAMGSHKMNTAAMMAFQHQKRQYSSQGNISYSSIATASSTTVTPTVESGSIHPASPKRSRQNSSHQHAIAQLAPNTMESGPGISALPDFPSSSVHSATTAANVSPSPSAKRPRRPSTALSSRTSTAGSPHLVSADDARVAKVAKTSVTSSAAAAASAAASGVPMAMATRTPSRVGIAKGPSSTVLDQVQAQFLHPSQPQVQARTQPPQPGVIVHYTHVPTTVTTTVARTAHTGNVTHPRRAAQNRAAQRTFRNRRKAYIKDMEQKVLEYNQTKAMFEEVQNQNLEMWRRLRILESFVAQHGLTPPSFAPLIPFWETDAGIAAAQAQAQAASAASAGGDGSVYSRTSSRNSQTSEIDGEAEDGHNLTYSSHHSGISSIIKHEESQDEDGEHDVDARVEDLDVRRST
ncbi:hypothetical protein BGZ54_006426 [Gamsiella multidivaricata]|nr:hypothetical protein BGZ54_006426 [Gamsiella multidivaricata]